MVDQADLGDQRCAAVQPVLTQTQPFCHSGSRRRVSLSCLHACVAGRRERAWVESNWQASVCGISRVGQHTEKIAKGTSVAFLRLRCGGTIKVLSNLCCKAVKCTIQASFFWLILAYVSISYVFRIYLCNACLPFSSPVTGCTNCCRLGSQRLFVK